MNEFESNPEDRESVLGQIYFGPLESHLNTNLIPEAYTGPSSVIIESQEVPIPDQALFIIKPTKLEPIPLPTPQEAAVIKVIVESTHRSPILEESEETNSDSSKMDTESTTANLEPADTAGLQGDTQPEVAIQNDIQTEANIIVNPTEEAVTEDGVQNPEKVVEIKSLPIETENPNEISEGLAKMTLKKEDSAIEDKVVGEPDKPKELSDMPESATSVILEPGPTKKADKVKSVGQKPGAPKSKLAGATTKPAVPKPLTKPQRPTSVAAKTTISTNATSKPTVRKAPAEPLSKPAPPNASSGRPPSTIGRPTTTVRSAPPATKRIPPLSTTRVTAPPTTRPASVASGEKKEVIKKPLSARPASVAEKSKPDVKKPVPAKRSAPTLSVAPAAPKPTLPASTLRPSSDTSTAKNKLPKRPSTITAKPLTPKGKPTLATTPQKPATPQPNKTLAATPSPSAARVASARANATALTKTPSRLAPTSAGKKPLPGSGIQSSKKIEKKSDEAPPASSLLHDSPTQVNGNPVVVEANGMNGHHAENDEIVNIVIDSQPEA